jgi:hypothetical protein
MLNGQSVFLVFYAIFWSGILNVQPRWKAFHWPLFCRKPDQARRRTLLSLLILSFFPIGFFVFAMWLLGSIENFSGWRLSWEYLRAAIVSFAIFGMYRIWLGIIECFPKYFYAPVDDIPRKYQHVEPTYRQDIGCKPSCVFVDIGIDTGRPNIVWGVIYIAVSVVFLLIK